MSAFQRFARALEARDEVHVEVHVALNQPQNHDTQEKALAGLDTVLLLLMGAVDAVARVAHRVLGLSGSEFDAGWQRTRWRAAVREVAPDLAAVIDNSDRQRAALTLLSRLRNSIHGEALQGAAYQSGASPIESGVELSVEDAAAVLAAMEDLGGRDAWGIRLVSHGTMLFDPAAWVERLVDCVVDLLNSLMRETPVERLPLPVTPAPTRAPIPDWQDPFNPMNRRAVRLLLGMGHDALS